MITGRINWWSNPAPVLEENYYLEPPSSGYPTVHFRHAGTANVLFLDGHLESRPPTDNPLPGYWPDDAAAKCKQVGLYDVGSTDELFDRD